MIKFFFDLSIVESLLATMLMSVSMGLIGTLCVVKKKSLNGEMLSHSALPGVALSYILFGALSSRHEFFFSLILILITFLICLLSQAISAKLLKHQLSEDATLCVMLSFGLGFGILLQSFLQKFHPMWFKKTQLFFYGQAATLVWEHVYLYALLCFVLAVFIVIFHTRIKWYLFDEHFFKAHQCEIKWIEVLIDILITLAIVIGIRSCGVILVSGMLIIPVIAARSLSSSLKWVYTLSAFIGAISAFIGNYLSFNLPIVFAQKFAMSATIALGPVMIIVAFSICLLILLLSPKKGLIACGFKQIFYFLKVQKENALKRLWIHRENDGFTLAKLFRLFGVSYLSFCLLMINFILSGTLKKVGSKLFLTKKGLKQVAHIVRIHRLFELYLSKHLNVDLKNVHGIAEELEHVISDDMENQMSILLNHPTKDPHQQPIPPDRGHV